MQRGASTARLWRSSRPLRDKRRLSTSIEGLELFGSPSDPFVWPRALRFQCKDRTFVLVGTHHGVPRASSTCVERVLESVRPDTIVVENAYLYHQLPPSETRSCEFAFTSQWAYQHGVKLVRGNPTHDSLEGRRGRPYHEVRWGGFEAEAPDALPAFSDDVDRTETQPTLLLRASAPMYRHVVLPLVRLGDLVCRTHHLLAWDDRIFFGRYFPLMHRIYMSSVERELFFVKALREAPGTSVVGVFGMLHLAGIIHMWDEYKTAPYALWRTTVDEGKDTTRTLARTYARAVAAHWRAHALTLMDMSAPPGTGSW